MHTGVFWLHVRSRNIAPTGGYGALLYICMPLKTVLWNNSPLETLLLGGMWWNMWWHMDNDMYKRPKSKKGLVL